MQRWADCHILRSSSSPEFLKLIPSPNIDQNNKKLKSKSKVQKFSKMQLFIDNNYAILVHWLIPNPVLVQNLCSILQSGANPSSTKFVIVRIQSNPSPVQCSSQIWCLWFLVYTTTWTLFLSLMVTNGATWSPFFQNSNDTNMN